MCAFRLRHALASRCIVSSEFLEKRLRVSSETPCPYIAGRTEIQAFAVFKPEELKPFSQQMNRMGFRRSMNTAYIPICPGCRACQSVRVLVDKFQPSRSFRRVQRNNIDLRFRAVTPEYTEENYALFHQYLRARHPDSDMNTIDADYFRRLVQIVPQDAFLLCAYDAEDRLLAVAMVDDFDDGLSAVYSFFDPTMPKRSLGLMMVLEIIARARLLGKPYVYLGYYIAEAPNMAYKTRFAPLECYNWQSQDWQEFSDD